eukprot:TRINITY_DN11539_c0_g1_i4.p1 TRINITY_DN11539_c0_g1~~TRINITY_DN11539_c0_g1_i4.p1  ORF type:complete len:434 (+),score=57.94 TRINITY_DN11539_c0_g1_i4:259-1560(+)
MICVCCGLWGIYSGVTTAAVEAIFGDSIPSGKRQNLYLWRDGLGTGARALGPLLAVVYFVIVDATKWKLHDVQIVMLGGLVLAVVPCLACFFFNDADTLGKESEAFNAGAKKAPAFRTVYDPTKGAATNPHRSNGLTHLIPLIQFYSSLAMGIASGITSKYFPIYFADDIGLDPRTVMGIYAVMPLTTSACSFCVMNLSYKIGRVQSVLLCLVIGIPLLFFMAAMGTSFWNSEKALLIGVQVVRTSVMNAYSPVSRSILNDWAPKDQRARWNSLSSIQKVGWSGSAMLGGFIIKKWSYSVCFWVTGSVQLIGLAIRLVLLRIVPDDPVRESGRETDSYVYAMTKESFLGEPELKDSEASDSQGSDQLACERRFSTISTYSTSTPRNVPQQSYWGTDDALWDSISSFFTGQSDDDEALLEEGQEDNDLSELAQE